MELRDYAYIDDLSSRGDFDDWYNAILRDQIFKGKTFEELDLNCQLWACKQFEKDYLERD